MVDEANCVEIISLKEEPIELKAQFRTCSLETPACSSVHSGSASTVPTVTIATCPTIYKLYQCRQDSARFMIDQVTCRPRLLPKTELVADI